MLKPFNRPGVNSPAKPGVNAPCNRAFSVHGPVVGPGVNARSGRRSASWTSGPKEFAANRHFVFAPRRGAWPKADQTGHSRPVQRLVRGRKTPGPLAAFAALLLIPLLSGCPAPQTASDNSAPPLKLQDGRGDTGAFKQTDPWLLTTMDRKANLGNHGVFLGNGYIGATIGEGDLWEMDRAAMSSHMWLRVAGIYDGSNEIIKQIAVLSPSGGIPPLFPGEMRPSKLDMRTGVLTTEPLGDNVADKYTIFVSRRDPHLMALRFEHGALTSANFGRDGMVQVNTTKVSDGQTVATATVVANRNGNELFQAVYSSGDTTDPKTTAKEAALKAYKTGFDTLLADHENAWQKIWQDADITIEGDPEAQQLVHKLMFDLLQSTRPGASDSIAPESLSGDFYKGHIFWDAEIWMFPALLAQHPDYARSILDYRFKHLGEAKAQAKSEGYAGADFPWESAASGKEVAPSGFSKGRHVTAGVGWAHWQYWLATQDKAWLKTRGWPVLSAVADFWASRAKKNPQTGKWDILDVYGPDELKQETDNNTYTNAMARYCLLAATEAATLVGQPAKSKWQLVAENIALPFNKKGGYYQARQNDDNKPTKQADGELVLYPADLPMDKKTADTTYDFQAKRPIRNGPAMTDAMHALIAARLGRADEAEKAFRNAYRPFVRGPFLLFSEKRSMDRCVFTTGAGGVLQAVIYGFGGLDVSKPGGIIGSKPALPTSWKKLTITGIRRGGKRYTLTVTPEKRTLTAEG